MCGWYECGGGGGGGGGGGNCERGMNWRRGPATVSVVRMWRRGPAIVRVV